MRLDGLVGTIERKTCVSWQHHVRISRQVTHSPLLPTLHRPSRAILHLGEAPWCAQHGLLVDQVGPCPCFGTFSGKRDVGRSGKVGARVTDVNRTMGQLWLGHSCERPSFLSCFSLTMDAAMVCLAKALEINNHQTRNTCYHFNIQHGVTPRPCKMAQSL